MPQVVEDNSFDPIQIRTRIEVIRVRRLDIQLVFRTEVLVVFVYRDFYER